MKFYTFTQNNSGGHFDFDKKNGVSEYIIIEAPSAVDANKKFDLILSSYTETPSCPCCGERWHDQFEDEEGTNSPEIYGKHPEYVEGYRSPKGKTSCVHLIDGTKEWY